MKNALPIATIIADNKPLPGAYNLLSLETSKVVNKIPFAQLRLIDGDAAAQSFIISSDDFFAPGVKVEIKLNFQHEAATTVFIGLVVSHNIKSSTSGSLLIVELQDECSKLNAERRSAVFNDITDSAMIKQLSGAIKLDKLDATEAKHHQLVQYQCSDWDFILSRADVCGRLIYAQDGQLSLSKPDLSGKAALQFDYGISECFDFDFSVNISQQYEAVNATHWDSKTQQLVTPHPAAAFNLRQGADKAAQAGQPLNRDTQTLNAAVNMADKEPQAWADARMLKNRLAMFRGTLTVSGNAILKPGDLLDIKGVGKRFNGKTLITGISHRVTEQGWQTTIAFGLSGDWYSGASLDINQQPAGGLMPAISGLQVGVVEAFAKDPEKLQRIKVSIPALNNNGGNSVWARMAMTYAGKNKGLIFIPDKGDEVLVGFINDDPRQAFILGGAFSDKNPLPEPAALDKINAFKGIVSHSDLRLAFDDDNKTITLSTPANNSIVVDDKKGISVLDAHKNQIRMTEQGICLQDKNGNKIELSGKGIQIQSCDHLETQASGNIDIKASSNMKLKASMIDLN